MMQAPDEMPRRAASARRRRQEASASCMPARLPQRLASRRFLLPTFLAIERCALERYHALSAPMMAGRRRLTPSALTRALFRVIKAVASSRHIDKRDAPLDFRCERDIVQLFLGQHAQRPGRSTTANHQYASRRPAPYRARPFGRLISCAYMPFLILSSIARARVAGRLRPSA